MTQPAAGPAPKMSQITVRSNPDMGPLEVSVYSPDGEATEFTLSSGQNEGSAPAGPGRYAIVARRPNGARLRRTVEVATEDVTVDLAADVGETPNEFMHAETQRGLITPRPPPTEAPRRRTGARVRPRSGASKAWRPGLLGAGATALASAALATHLPNLAGLAGLATGAGALLAGALTVDPFAVLKERSRRDKRQPLSLVLWTCTPGGWSAAPGAPSVSHVVSADFLKVSIPPLQWPAAIGLIDETGLGPVLTLPPFRDGMELTFIAKGVSTWAADRTENPGGDRTPVALVTPFNPSAADMLAALAAPATPPAAALWDQTASRLAPEGAGAGDEALGMLLEKFDRPAEALLAAHYLLRFLPARLPLQWADNLVLALPSAADGPVIAAWARILSPPAGVSDDQIDADVDRLVALALARPAVLFARTRQLLSDALSLSESRAAAAGRAAQAEYRRFGAGAGGLEGIWGAAPDAPGGKVEGAERGAVIAEFSLVDGRFVEEKPEPEPLKYAFA